MIELPQRVLDEIDIFKNGHVCFYVNQYDGDSINKVREDIIEVNRVHKNIPIILLYRHETISDLSFLDKLYKIISEFENYMLISTSTACEFPHSTHPLTNIYMWKGLATWKSVNRFSENVELFPENEYKNKKIEKVERKFKSILSSRNQNQVRDELFKRDFKLDCSVVRYIKWDMIEETTGRGYDEFPNTIELINEYKNSYFSFVVETSHGDSDVNHYTNLTEKTLIAIMSGTIPIVLGGRGFVNSLEKMGIKVWNNEFGFGHGDLYTNYSPYKIDKFIDCINNVNKLSMTDSKNYWINNIESIQKNYDLISKILYM